MGIFRRPTARYTHTPLPVTPYQAAGQVWDERIGSARVQACSWRLMAFGCLLVALLMAGGLVWRAGQSQVTPFVVEVDSLGQVRAVGEATTPYRPTDAQIAYHLNRFINNVRSLSIDPIVVRNNWLEAYHYTTDRGAAFLNDYARSNDPFAHIGQRSIAVDDVNVVRASAHSFQVTWIERSYLSGALSATERWTAIVTVVIQPPRNEQRLRRNPLGIYVDGLNWGHQLSASDAKKY
jgi:type IV secretion system protein VirB5